jgi:hypothetical protein
MGEELPGLSDESAVPWAIAGLAIITISAAIATMEYFISNLKSLIQLSVPSYLNILGPGEAETAHPAPFFKNQSWISSD